MDGKAVVAGIGESEYFKRGGSPETEFQLAVKAIERAANDAGLDVSEIDGVVSYMDNRNDPLRLAAALGIKNLRWSMTPWAGGGNNSAAAIQCADAAVSSGHANYVVAFRALAQGQFSRFGSSFAGVHQAEGAHAWTHPYGLMSPAQECALQTKRFMHDYGITQETLCDISMACYANAQRNPRAVRYGSPLTREKYHNSRWIVEPFHLYDCCPENDGAAAAIITTPERARDLKTQAVPILTTAQGLGPDIGIDSFQGRWFPGTFYRGVADVLWQLSGVKPSDIDVVQLYENFTGPVMMMFSELGYCEPGEVADFVANGALEGPDAQVPFNTSGGNIGEAYIHGFEMINEAVRQVRGESTCQVNDVQYSLAVGGPGYAPGSAVLFGKG